MDIAVPFVKLLVFIALLALIVLGTVWPLSQAKRATFAVLRRNFVGYFSNPTG